MDSLSPELINITDEELKNKIEEFYNKLNNPIYKELKSKIEEYFTELYDYYLNLDKEKINDYIETGTYTIESEGISLNEFINKYKNYDNIKSIQKEYELLNSIFTYKINEKIMDYYGNLKEEEINEKINGIYQILNSNSNLMKLRKYIDKEYYYYLKLTDNEIRKMLLQNNNSELYITDFIVDFDNAAINDVDFYDELESIKKEIETSQDIKLLKLYISLEKEIEVLNMILNFKIFKRLKHIMNEFSIDDIELMLKKYDLDSFYNKNQYFSDYPARLFTNINVDLAKKMIYNYNSAYIKYIPDEIFNELDKDDIITHIEQKKYFFPIISKIKKIKIINTIGLVETMRLINRAERKIFYEIVDNIKSEDFDTILNDTLFDGIEECKCIYNNKEYIKKLLDIGYLNIIYNLDDNLVNTEILNAIDNFLKTNYHQYMIFSIKDQLKSDKLINFFTSKCHNINYYDLVNNIPKSKLTIDRILKCYIMIGDNYQKAGLIREYPEIEPYINRHTYELNEEGIKYLISIGFKVDDYSKLTITELETFLVSGQVYLLDRYQKKQPYYSTPVINIQNNSYNFTTNCIEIALENGYKFTKNSNIDSFPTNAIEYFCKKEVYDILIPYILDKDFFNLAKTYIYDKGYDSIFTFSEEVGIADELYNNILFSESIEELNLKELSQIKEKYSNIPEIIEYIEFVTHPFYGTRLEFIQTKEDIYNYFDEFGAKRNLFDNALLANEQLFFKLFVLTTQSNIYSRNEEDASIKAYIDFINQYLVHEIYEPVKKIIKNKENINNYFTSTGPNKNLYDAALFNNKKLFQILFIDNSDWKNIYNDETDKETLEYIKLLCEDYSEKKYDLFSKIIKEKENINNYFTSTGPSKELYDKALFKNKKLFDFLFNDNKWIETYTNSHDISTISYINFLKAEEYNSLITAIRNKEDIEKYFDYEGPNRNLYDKALFYDKKIYYILFKNDNWKKKYNTEEDKVTITYINFIKKYDSIFNKIIREQKDIEKYFNEDGYTEELKLLIKNDSDMTQSILLNAAHNDNILENLDKDFVNLFEYYLIDKYFSNCENPKEQYNYLLEKIGPKILFNFENNSIKKMIHKSKQELDIFFNLFDLEITTISKQDASNNISASLIDYKFRREHKDIIDIFTNMRIIIDQASENEILEYLENNVIYNKTSKLDYWFKKIVTELEYDDIKVEQFKTAINNYKKSHKTDLLHEICKSYIRENERKYAKTNHSNILLDFGIKPVYDNEDKIKVFSSYLLKNIDYDKFTSIREKYFDMLNDGSIKGYEKLKTLTIEQYNLITKAINNRQQPDASVKQEFSILKKFIGKLSKFYIENNLISEEKLRNLNFDGVSPAIALEKIDMMKILNELDIETYLEYAKENPKLVDNLRKIINSYGLGRLPESITEVFQNKYGVELPNGINNIGTFITKYQQLLKNEKKHYKDQGIDISIENIHMPFAKVIEAISLANSETYELRRLLGKNEYYVFAANKPPNEASSYDRKTREEVLGNIVDYLYILSDVTIPSHDMIFESEKSHKKINFIVGNRTNASNICHGERTGACMRIGGVGEGLFLKCLTDKNWFHIRIEDPITHEYISRVSGFRNGNTVYLNQLRDTAAGTNYTNEDLQEYIRIYAEKLIEETKKSKFPVENVFINNRYAMEDVKEREYYFGEKIQSEYNLNDVQDLCLNKDKSIWTDVKSRAILLATTEDGKNSSKGYVSLRNGPEETEIYKAVRDKIYGFEYQDEEIPKHCFVEVDKDILIEKINRVHAMREKLSGKDYRYDIEDEITEEEQIIDGYASADWFVYLDSDNNIHKEYISEIETEEETILYNQADEAKTEMEYYTEILMKKYNLESKMVHAV